MANMMSLKLIAFTSSMLAILPYALAAIPAGSNTYLPPKVNGYDYQKPDKPFPTRPIQPTGPTSVQPGGGRPGPGPRPTPGPNRPTPGIIRPTPGPIGPGPGPRPQQPGEDHHHHHEPGMPFDFEYAVNDIDTSNDYSHKAASDGDVTRGEYRVQLPDGRTQVVRYTADWKTGFHADVSYEGQARFPEGPSVFGGQSSQGYRY